jgi:hypothetical protein
MHVFDEGDSDDAPALSFFSPPLKHSHTSSSLLANQHIKHPEKLTTGVLVTAPGTIEGLSIEERRGLDESG